jgi:hypothetical protein
MGWCSDVRHRELGEPSMRHDFARPWAPHRLKVYFWCAAFGLLFSVLPIILVGTGVWPMEPTGLIFGPALCVPLFVAMAAAWWDAPGENRTTLEKSNEFLMVWFPITAASEIFWELVWLVGDVLGYMDLTEQDRWGWLWWIYGVADIRYLTSDPGLYAVETFVVIGGITLFVQWFRLGTAGDDIGKRINALWWSCFALTNNLTAFGIYYVSETRASFEHLEQGFWGFVLKFLFMNSPWLVGPAICLPFIVKQLAYLYRISGPPESPSPESPADAHDTRDPAGSTP